MASSRLARHIRAPRSRVYQALIDPDAIEKWDAPDGMTCEVHEFEAREGGRFRISLKYEEPTGAGKTTSQTDTYHGYIARLVPDEMVVEVIEFETTDPSLQGQMTTTITLSDKDGGTLVEAAHENLPPGLSPADNELGWRMALDNLAALVEAA